MDEFGQEVGHYIRITVLGSVARWQQCIDFCRTSGKEFEYDYTPETATTVLGAWGT